MYGVVIRQRHACCLPACNDHACHTADICVVLHTCRRCEPPHADGTGLQAVEFAPRLLNSHDPYALADNRHRHALEALVAALAAVSLHRTHYLLRNSSYVIIP